jgi:uncharacterized protein HemX
VSTAAIVFFAIAVALIAAIAILAFLTPRRRLAAERDRAADRHRELASVAERRAQRARAEAEIHASRADLHDRGLADDELATAGPDEETAQIERIDQSGSSPRVSHHSSP